MNILLLVRDHQDKEKAMDTFAKIYGKDKCKFIDVSEVAMCLDSLFIKHKNPHMHLVTQVIRNLNYRVPLHAYDENVLIHDIPNVVSEFEHAFDMFFGHIYNVYQCTSANQP